MKKEEIFDKIDKIREVMDGFADSYNITQMDDVVILLDELKDDVELLMEDEFDRGYNSGIDRIEEN